jgi:hypothetical protein
MSAKERTRKSVLDQVESGQLGPSEAARLLGLSYRQFKRIRCRYRREGDAGLVHRGRGRSSTRAKPQALREAVLVRCRTVYAGLGPTLAAEKLLREGLVVDHETLRRWLVADGQWQRRRKRGRHRTRRERKARFGELLQLDGSHHAWFGPEHAPVCLMNLVDDATGRTLTFMAEQETTEAAMTVLENWVTRRGVPIALYCDRKNVYITERAPTLEEQLAGEGPMTVFGQACKKLGIKIVPAKSPQAKGRVERKHGVYQDRFVHELRLEGITTIESANTLLAGRFDAELNEKFAVSPRDPHDAHRALPRHLDLRDVFCTDEIRTVTNDWCVQHHNRHYQILKLNSPLPRPKDKVLVRTWRDGSIYIIYKTSKLKFSLLPAPPPRSQAPSKHSTPKTTAPQSRPADNHPWRRARIKNTP